MTNDSVEQRLIQAKRVFEQNLVERLERLRDCLLEANTVTTARQAASEEAHKLAGTAASFGFCELGALCGRIDDELGQMRSHNTTQLAEELSRFIDELC